MKAMRFALAVGAVASLALAPAGFAAVSCLDRTLSAITAPAGDAGKECQNALAKAAMSYVKSLVKTDAKCMSKQIPGACPNSKDTAKVQKAAIKARDAVVKACGGGALAGLNSSYNLFADPADVASCTLSQNSVEGRELTFVVNGTPGKVRENKDRDKCVKTLNQAGVKYALGVLQTVNGCLAKAIKAGTAGDLTAQCVGHWAAGLFVPPSDIKIADKLTGLRDKLTASVDKGCTAMPAGLRTTLYACAGSATLDDYKNCLACESWDTTLDLLTQQYSETGKFVANGPGAIQAAVDAAAPNAKLLLDSGDYQEQVSITSNVLHSGTQLVGCGAATDERPNLKRPGGPGPYLNGIFAANVDGLLFQSMDVTGGWDENGIFVTGANGVSFRDVITDGGDGSATCVGGGNDGNACTAQVDCPDGVCTDAVSTYGIFPVQSSNVLVELCEAINIRDAGIYVGQCSDPIRVRYNLAHGNVAGMEIENSTGAKVHNNYSTGNVGGLLVFKLPGPEVQRGELHEIYDNVIIANNTKPNYAIPGTSVAGIPPGTGVVVLSVKDCDFHHNLVSTNNSYGFAVIDQIAFDALAGGPLMGQFSHTCDAPDAPYTKCTEANEAIDCPMSLSCSQDQKLTGNKIRDNLITPDNADDPYPGSAAADDIAYAVLEEDPGPNFNNNCVENNGGAHLTPAFGTILNNCP